MTRAQLVVIAFAIAVAANVARGDDRKTAERKFRAGEKAYQSQNFEAAVEDFEQAYKALPIPEIAFSAAQAYRRLFRLEPKVDYAARAVELYKLYLGKVHSGGRVADAADALSEMEHELDKMIKAGAKVSPQVAAEHTQLGISVELGDAGHLGMHEVEEGVARGAVPVTVTLDGKSVEPNAPNNVVPGDHKIHVEAPGYLSIDRIEGAVQGTANMVEIVLAPKPARVAIKTEAESRISIDGRPSGSAPHAPLELAPGKHLVAITHRGREAVVRELVLSNGQELSVDVELVPTWRRRALPPLAVGAGALAIASVGSVLLAKHYDSSARSDADTIHRGNAQPSTLADYDSAHSDRDAWRTAAWWTGTAALGVAALGAALWYFDEPSPESSRITPLAASGVAGAAISGHF